jgi:hypothetical protein
MALREGRKRGGSGDSERSPSRTPLGGVRRAQMITTYGVGSMIAIGDQSYIISGLDSWRVGSSPNLHEPRLEHWLGVSGFHLPPAATPPAGDGVKVRVFPEFYSCANCKELKELRKFNSDRKNECSTCEKPLTPSRFVIACENGHLDDFPYFAWVHKRTSSAETGLPHRLSLHSTGRTASLRSVIVRCSCGVSDASLEGAFGKAALTSLGIRCRGRRPWLGSGATQSGCEAAPRTLQRGSSAAWFPLNRSALSIPPWSETLQNRLNGNPTYKILKGMIASGVDESLIFATIKDSGILDDTVFTPADLLEAIEQRQELEASERPDSDGPAGFEPAGRLRREEYDKLWFGTATTGKGADFECIAPAPPAQPPYGVERSMLVKRLREVRVLQSFTRVQAPDALEGNSRNADLSNTDVGWLPAIEVSGEGVFLGVDQKRLHEWEMRGEVLARADRIRDNHTEQLRRRAMAVSSAGPISEIRSPIRPRYILLHTLAHALINEWSLEAGYPAASLRERLYVADTMAGVLIYTATSDSAGSLGGVVAQGEYQRLRTSLESALSRVSWCSQDPPCMESEASGVDSLNLAACYACVLLPETSCETNNTFLDRAMLIGTTDDPAIGFFSPGN